MMTLLRNFRWKIFYLKETVNKQNKDIEFLRNELLSRNKVVELLVTDKLDKRISSSTNKVVNKVKEKVNDETKFNLDKQSEGNSHKRSIVILGDSLLKDRVQHKVRKGLNNSEKYL